MKEFKITKNEAGQRLDKYLKKLLPQAPSGFVYKMLRKKNIVLNGKKADQATKLAQGDLVHLFLSDETFEKFHGTHREDGEEALFLDPLPVIYENEDLLVINKPAGLLSQKAAPTDRSANEWILHYLLSENKISREELSTFRPSICNRLDRNTSGILIAGKTLHGLQEMSRQLKERSIAKYYRCIVSGSLKEPRRLQGYLCKDHRANRVRISMEKQGDENYIEMEYQPVCCYPDATMLEVHLITGRSHQIRAHLASIGHPIIGDPKYGSNEINRRFQKELGLRHQLLHAYRLVLEDGTKILAPLPEYFLQAEQLCTGVKQEWEKGEGNGDLEFPRASRIDA